MRSHTIGILTTFIALWCTFSAADENPLSGRWQAVDRNAPNPVHILQFEDNGTLYGEETEDDNAEVLALNYRIDNSTLPAQPSSPTHSPPDPLTTSVYSPSIYSSIFSVPFHGA